MTDTRCVMCGLTETEIRKRGMEIHNGWVRMVDGLGTRFKAHRHRAVSTPKEEP